MRLVAAAGVPCLGTHSLCVSRKDRKSRTAARHLKVQRPRSPSSQVSKSPLLNVTSDATQLAPLVTSPPRRCYCSARKAQFPVSRCSRPVQHCSSGVSHWARVLPIPPTPPVPGPGGLSSAWLRPNAHCLPPRAFHIDTQPSRGPR